MMTNKQCPRCLRKTHIEVIATEKKKRYAIDRCAYVPCSYNFDIEEIKLEPKALEAPKHVDEDKPIPKKPTGHYWHDLY